jgi:hypothetical protein
MADNAGDRSLTKSGHLGQLGTRDLIVVQPDSMQDVEPIEVTYDRRTARGHRKRGVLQNTCLLQVGEKGKREDKNGVVEYWSNGHSLAPPSFAAPLRQSSTPSLRYSTTPLLHYSAAPPLRSAIDRHGTLERTG